MRNKQARKHSVKGDKNRVPKESNGAASTSDSPATPARKRQRAADFATKKPSGKKRQNKQNEASSESSKKRTPNSARKKKASKAVSEGDDDAQIEDMMTSLRELVEKNAKDGPDGSIDPQLVEALKKADEAFECEQSDSNSSTSADEDDELSDADTPAVSNGRRAVEQPTDSGDETPEQSAKHLSLRKKVMESARCESKRKKKTSHRDNAEAEHQAEIEALKREDPQFYRFLQENDASLLDFNLSESDEEASNASDGENDMNGDQTKNQSSPASQSEQDDDSSESEGESDDDLTNPDKLRPKKLVSRSSSKVAERKGSPQAMETDEDSDSESEDISEPETSKGGEKDVLDSEASDTSDDLSKKKVTADSDRDHDDDEETGSVKDHDNGLDLEDEPGYSEDEDGDSEAEAEAAAEAGLKVESDNSADESEVPNDGPKKKKTTVVDMKYLRDLEQNLKSSKSSIKAVKDLLRIFRAGRELLTQKNIGKVSKEKAKKVEKKRSHNDVSAKELADMEEDDFDDDGGFTSGKVTFASSVAYQKAMNMAIIGIQDTLDRMLEKPRSKDNLMFASASNWNPAESTQWLNLRAVLKPYVFHMISLCEEVVDPKTIRFLLKRLERLVPYTQESKALLKRLIRVGTNAWCAKEYHSSQATRLRAYLLIRKLAHGAGNTETVLRTCCNVYTAKIANACNPKTLPLIQFAVSCLVELFGIDMGASYSTAFSSLREMAISLRAVLTSKEAKEEVERIHNWGFINRLRLWSRVLSKYGSADELQALIYPYVQVSLGIMRVQPTPRTYPLRLHVASYLSDLSASVGTFIPVVPHLLALLRCSELQKKPAAGTSKVLEWRGLLRVSDEVVKTKSFLTGIIDGVVLQIAKYFAAMSKHVSLPEVSYAAESALRKFSKTVMVSEWRSSINMLVEKLRETSAIIVEARAKADFSPHGAISADGMLGIVPGLNREQKMPIERLYDVQSTRAKLEEGRRDERDGSKKREAESESEAESGEERPVKKAKVGKRKQPKLNLHVPADADMEDEDEDDQVIDLQLDSDDDE